MQPGQSRDIRGIITLIRDNGEGEGLQNMLALGIYVRRWMFPNQDPPHAERRDENTRTDPNTKVLLSARGSL